MKKTKITEDSSFSEMYTLYFPKMVRFALEYIIIEEDAKNIIQDIFLQLWERKDTLEAISNLNAFLFTLTKNRCIDHYRLYTTQKSRNESLDALQERELHLKMEALIQFDENMFSFEDMEKILDKAIDNLPEKCKQIFILSRMEGLKHEEIAEQLDISIHTVQNHIAAALRKLRVELKDYLPLFIFMF